jgi:hypothetical protein
MADLKHRAVPHAELVVEPKCTAQVGGLVNEGVGHEPRQGAVVGKPVLQSCTSAQDITDLRAICQRDAFLAAQHQIDAASARVTPGEGAAKKTGAAIHAAPRVLHASLYPHQPREHVRSRQTERRLGSCGMRRGHRDREGRDPGQCTEASPASHRATPKGHVSTLRECLHRFGASAPSWCGVYESGNKRLESYRTALRVFTYACISSTTIGTRNALGPWRNLCEHTPLDG